MRGLPLGLTVVLAAVPAFGDEPPDRGTVIEAWTGLGSADSAQEVGDDYSHDSGLFEFGMMLRYRWRWLTAGALADVGGEFDGPSHVHLAPTAGLAIELIKGMVVDALFEVGGHQLSDIASGYYYYYEEASNPAPMWLGYMGVRVGLSARFGHEVRIILGGWASIRRDLTQERVEVETDYCAGYEADECALDVGGAAGVIAFRAGVEL